MEIDGQVPDSPPRRVSVVIPVYQAAATLGEQLDGFAGQRGVEDWEIVLADNGSTDGWREVVAGFEDRLPLRTVDASERQGAAHARNAGAAAASGEILLFCDADDRVGDGWLAAMVAGVEAHGFVASRFEVERLNRPEVAAAHRHAQETGLNPYTYPEFLPHAGGAGLGVRREIHEALGGFDETLVALEDTDYCWRGQLAGHPLVFAGDAVVHVRFKDDPGADVRQLYSYGIHNVEIYSRYRDRGMPRLGVLSGVKKWVALLVKSPRLLSRRGRRAWMAQLGWRVGRLVGCWRYRVLAP